MKQLRIGQEVKIADPVHLAARFYKSELGGLSGAGGIVIPRDLIDGPGFVVSIAAGTKKTRGLIAFGSPDSNSGMWLDVDALTTAKE
jgi:hypothetical protein